MSDLKFYQDLAQIHKRIDEEDVLKNVEEYFSSFDLVEETEFKVKKFKKILEDLEIDFSRPMLQYYTSNGLIPKPRVISKTQALYTKEHVFHYILISFFKDDLDIHKLNSYFEALSPAIEHFGISDLCKKTELMRQIAKALMPEMKQVLINKIISNGSLAEEDDNEQFSKYESTIIISFLFFFIGKEMLKSFDKFLDQYKTGTEERLIIDRIIKEKKS